MRWSMGQDFFKEHFIIINMSTDRYNEIRKALLKEMTSEINKISKEELLEYIKMMRDYVEVFAHKLITKI